MTECAHGMHDMVIDNEAGEELIVTGDKHILLGCFFLGCTEPIICCFCTCDIYMGTLLDGPS